MTLSPSLPPALAPSSPLANFVSVRPRFARSAHLDRDWHAQLHAPVAYTSANSPIDVASDQDYHLTPSAYDLLKIIDGAHARPADRALTLVGPYGAGKSAFCVFLSGLVSGGTQETPLLEQRDPVLAQSLGAPDRRLVPVPVVGSREPLAPALINGLLTALEAQQSGLAASLRPEAESLLASPHPSPRRVADLFQSAARAAQEGGLGGILLLADELGKFLEYAALHPNDGDIFTLQELAEAATRSPAPLFVLAVLHQNADAYAHKLGRAHQAEWAKVGERFREVPFFPSDTERMDMVGYALEHAPELHLNSSFSALAHRGARRLPPSIGGRFEAMARAAYPLHPTTLLALPPLFRKTGQSHRSLFNFLAGQEAHALGRFLRDNSYSPAAPPLFMLDALFDYAAEVLLGGWSAGGVARLWAEAVEAVERTAGLSDAARRVLKCIALLGWLRDPHLPASPETLEWALTGTDGSAPDVPAALEELTQRHLIVWSRTRELFRLWEGGDVDVAAAMETARSSLGAGTTLRAATDRDLCPLPRLIARRYSFETGTLRSVETRPCAVGELSQLLQGQSTPAAGLCVVLCLVENAEEAERAQAIALAHAQAQNPNSPDASPDGARVLVGIALETELLREAALDVAAAGVVVESTPALQSDRAARRELAARRFEAENAFRDEWTRLFGPASDLVGWFHRGAPVEFAGGREFSAFLSVMAYQGFPATPVLRNELINRRHLSAAAAAGRRTLLEAMLLHGSEARLGIESFPPEFSMYECLLRAPGLHRETAPGVWAFGPPPAPDMAQLGPVWEAIGAWIFQTPPAPRPLPALWALLGATPFGLSEGVMPPLLLAFLLAHPHEISLYREGTFLSDPGVPDWEVLLRRPELFALAGCRLEGGPREFVAQLGLWLGVPGFLVPVVRELLARARNLPPFAWKTGQLSEGVRRLRGALENARSPETLLFEEVPKALGAGTLFGPAPQSTPAAQAQALSLALGEAFEAWAQAYPVALSRARDLLLQGCEFPPGEAGWQAWRQRAREWQGRIVNAVVSPVVVRAAMPGDDGSSLEAVLALVAGRAPRTWSDADEERFALQVERFGALFRQENQSSAAVSAPVSIFPSPPGPEARLDEARLSRSSSSSAREGATLSQEEAALSAAERDKCQAILQQFEASLQGASPRLRAAVLERLLEN